MSFCCHYHCHCFPLTSFAVVESSYSFFFSLTEANLNLNCTAMKGLSYCIPVQVLDAHASDSEAKAAAFRFIRSVWWFFGALHRSFDNHYH